jgi:hypothetical protein
VVGVYGVSATSVGVKGESSGGNGVVGKSTAGGANGVYGETDEVDGLGVSGRNTHSGAWGYLGGAVAVYGETTATNGTFAVYGKGIIGIGVVGESQSNVGVAGSSQGNDGIRGTTGGGSNFAGVWAFNSGNATYACLACGDGGAPYAGYFTGNVHVTGAITAGTKPFKIDHPLDPENKVLYHVAVESPDMKNIYDGVVTTDGQGFATVDLPEWFEALNRDFRYQLTVIGSETWARARIAREVEGNAFVIQTDVPHTRVSWQVTGIRHDPFAEVHRVPVEEDKPEGERGRYLHPEAYGRPGAQPATSGR